MKPLNRESWTRGFVDGAGVASEWHESKLDFTPKRLHTKSWFAGYFEARGYCFDRGIGTSPDTDDKFLGRCQQAVGDAGGVTETQFIAIDRDARAIFSRIAPYSSPDKIGDYLLYHGVTPMAFDELNQFIPSKVAGEKHSLSIPVYFGADGDRHWGVRVRLPGKYSSSDFVVEVYDTHHWPQWRQFTHAEFFADIQQKSSAGSLMHDFWVGELLEVCQGNRPPGLHPTNDLPGLRIDALTHAFQALTVCEFRRFPQGDAHGGGRYLPVNYSLAIMQQAWDADEASKMMQVGFPALRKLDGFIPFTHDDSPAGYLLDVHNNTAGAVQVRNDIP
jgi:hypothetical protein